MGRGQRLALSESFFRPSGTQASSQLTQGFAPWAKFFRPPGFDCAELSSVLDFRLGLCLALGVHREPACLTSATDPGLAPWAKFFRPPGFDCAELSSVLDF